MSLKRIPVIATLVVLVAVAIMVRLGFWQIDRLHQKEAMLARYQAAQGLPAVDGLPASPPGFSDHPLPQPDLLEPFYYRRVSFDCPGPLHTSTRAGRNSSGQVGFAYQVDCPGYGISVRLGWSNRPDSLTWQGGKVSGILTPGGTIVADPPLAGLQPNARPDPADIPNNHLSYAIQWFLFAITALVIYVLALRKRLRD